MIVRRRAWRAHDISWGKVLRRTLEAGTIAKDFDSAAAQRGDVLQRHRARRAATHGRCRSKCTREGNEGLDDTYVEKAWEYADTEEIEALAAELLGKAQEGQSIEDYLFCILYLAFRCGFKTAIGNDRTSMSE